VPIEVERGWNEQGDRIVIPSAPAPLAPLTLYDASEKVGYKAIVVQPDGSVDEDIWNELKQIASRRALADGTAVHAVRLIVPVRDNAIAIHPRAMADGFEMVTYPKGTGGVFWEVFPT
jgi:hypothetical protein